MSNANPAWDMMMRHRHERLDLLMGSNLRRMRQGRGMSIGMLSERSLVSVERIEEHEAGRATMSLHDLGRYATVFDTNHLDLLMRLSLGGSS